MPKVTIELHVPDELADAVQWLKDQRSLHVVLKSGCSQHGFAVLGIRNSERRDISLDDVNCLRDQLYEHVQQVYMKVAR